MTDRIFSECYSENVAAFGVLPKIIRKQKGKLKFNYFFSLSASGIRSSQKTSNNPNSIVVIVMKI